VIDTKKFDYIFSIRDNTFKLHNVSLPCKTMFLFSQVRNSCTCIFVKIAISN